MDFSEFKKLKFGTSGLRDTVDNMTDMECYINTMGFIAYLEKVGDFKQGDRVAIGGDRRPSTPRIKRAVGAAVRDMGGEVDDQGMTSTPSLTFHAIGCGIPSIMVTGSHIPADRNGIKFTRVTGEVLKSDEAGILESVEQKRQQVYSTSPDKLPFDEQGMFKPDQETEAQGLLKDAEYTGESEDKYVSRYAGFLGSGFLAGQRLFFYQHSAVGRDFIRRILKEVGAEVVSPEETVSIRFKNDAGAEQAIETDLRSADFVPVDTESVSQETMAVFRKIMNDHSLDIGVTTDGDSDRPLLVYREYSGGNPTDDVSYVTGDILGLLAVLALEHMGVKIDAVAVPISANDAVQTVLAERGVEVTQTRIGSPYVIKAMNDSVLKNNPDGKWTWNVVSWESNGGFLTGSDMTMNGSVLKALPTRDSVLPLLAIIGMAKGVGKPIASLLSDLPARYTYADRKKEFPREKSKTVINAVSPASDGVREIVFKDDGSVEISFLNGETETLDPGNEYGKIRERLSGVFTANDAFTHVVKVNYIDGVRVYFTNGDISHLRPSGNAPEFRNYAVSSTPERAKEIVRLGLSKIIPALAGD